VGLALVAAGGFGWYIIAIDAAAARDPLWALLVARTVSCALALGAAASQRAVGLPSRLLLLAVVAGVLDVTANAALVLALGRGYISLVSVLASLYPIVTVSLAFALLGERLGRVQLAGAVLALSGVALIATG
jgi:drug/metabolite transporter (DMT)-like permease